VAATTGQACNATTIPCAVGLDCVNGQCAAPGAKGDACGTGKAPCGIGLYCDATGNTCATKLAAGATCNGTGIGANSDCDDAQGLYCDPMSKKCTAYELAAATQACGRSNTGAITLCDTGGYCSGANANRTCSPAAKDGAACGPTASDATCERPANCTNAACAIFDPTTCK
jgi:hypothetical protein